jgi:phosphate transport system substrate-binding protein
MWSIGYDEFGYALSFGANAAWVQNASGQWVLPYAENISAALETAALRPDLSQELSGVYASTNPIAYPISAYSYIVTPCAPAADRTTCRGNYEDPATAQTMAEFLDYIACDGQVPAARMGYSPLPPLLSQEIVNSIGRMNGTDPPKQLSAANCSNPRYHGSLGEGSSAPNDPFAGLDPTGGGSGSGNRGTTGPGSGEATHDPCPTTTTTSSSSSTTTTTAPSDPCATTSTTENAGAGRGDAQSLGGSGEFRDADPTSYNHGAGKGLGLLPIATLLILLAAPPLGGALWARSRRSRQATWY